VRGAPPYFVDSGAWIALAIASDIYHDQAREKWQRLHESAAKGYTSVPVIIETFTFISRNTNLETAILWKDEIDKLKRLVILECNQNDLKKSWSWFERRQLYKLSAVDATSFELMRRYKINRVFTFDTHFSAAGFQIL
jgi:predicted nucleic acid-binding protein